MQFGRMGDLGADDAGGDDLFDGVPEFDVVDGEIMPREQKPARPAAD